MTIFRGKYFNWAAIALTISLFTYGISKWESRAPIDYYQFWAIGQAVHSMDLNNIYSKRDRSQIGRNLYQQFREQGASEMEERTTKYRSTRFTPAATPFFYSVFYLVSTGNFGLDYEIYRIGSLALFFASFLFLGVAVGIPAFVTALFLLFVCTVFFPFKNEISSANVNLVQVALLSFLMFMRSRKRTGTLNFLTGLAIGFTVMFKPNLIYAPSLMILFWMVKKQFEVLKWAAVGALCAASIALTLPSFVLGDMVRWRDWASGFQPMVFRGYFVNKSFLGLLLHSKNLAFHKVFSIILLSFPIAIIWGNRNREESRDAFWFKEYLLVWSGVAIYLLSGPLVHGHYFLLALPLALSALRPQHLGEKFSRQRQWAGLLGVALMAIHPLLWEKHMSKNWDLNLCSYVGVAVLLVSALWDLKSTNARTRNV